MKRALPALVACAAACSSGPDVAPRPDSIPIRVGGELFTEYRFSPEDRVPILYPLYGPGGVSVTRNYPMESVPGESTDHPHHRSLWFAHGDVNGFDFWHGSDAGERIALDEITGIHRSRGRVTVRSRHLWQVDGGETICVEERAMAFDETPEGRTIDFTIVLFPADEPIVFGDTKEGTMALRLAPSLRLSGEGARGQCLNSTGQEGGDCWGKRAAWVTYWGPVEGKTLGVALFDHPENPRHPTWWHARDYGLFAANPFGIHDFEERPEGTGDLTVEVGDELKLRYRLLLYAGEANPEALQRQFEAFAGS